MGTSSCSPSFPVDLQAMADSWSSGGSTQSSPESTWSPAAQSFGNSYNDESQMFLYPPPPYPHGSARVERVGLESVPVSPASSDSAFWDMGLENISPNVPYTECDSPWDMLAEEQSVAPLPDLGPECLEEVLGEMQSACWNFNGQMDRS